MHAKQLGILLALSVTACGGGGGGGGPADNTPPTVLAAAFLGAGAAPAAGDSLVLTFSEDVRLVAGTLLTDADVTLSGGGSLGTVTAAPAVLTARALSVTLGAGVAFTPGTTSIALAPTNDAVEDPAGNLGVGGIAETIEAGDGDNPTVTLLTVNGIEPALNGTGPAGGTAQTPQRGFTIDVFATDASSAIDVAKTTITASVTVNTPGGEKPAGTDLTSFFTAGTTPGATNSFFAPAGVTFPEGELTLTTVVIDTTGRPSTAATFAFRTRAINDSIRPLESGQVWFLDTSRDIESYTLTTMGSMAITEIGIVSSANGESDLVDLLLIAGLLSSTPIQVTATEDSNDVVSDRLEDSLLADLATLFAGANVTFTFDAPGTFPQGSSVPYDSLGFSQMCIGGAAAQVATGTLGAAIFDPHNGFQNNNCLVDFQNTRLGVFVHTLFSVGYINGGPTTTFQQTYRPLTPSLNGTPIGNDPQDAQRLLGTLNDGRTTTIDNAISRFTKSIAVVVAHECGHSMGLVANGPMPGGLYGNDPGNFPVSPLPPGAANSHIDNRALFPVGSQNVMSPAIEFDAALSDDTGFNKLNLSYLRERVLTDN